MSIERRDYGPVRIRKGRHKGTLGYYDDDLDGEERAAKAIVYLGEPFESDCILPGPGNRCVRRAPTTPGGAPVLRERAYLYAAAMVAFGSR